MNKRFIWIIGAIVIFAIIAFSMYRTGASSTEPKLSAEEISSLVEAQYPGTHGEPILSIKDGEPVYEVEINQNTGSYSATLHGDTGRVLDLYERESTQGSQANNEEKESKSQGTEEDNDGIDDNETANNDKEKNDSTSGEKENAIISSDEAKGIALREFSGTVTELELDEDDDMLIYEIEIVNGNKEASIEINAYTGNVVVIEIDDED